MPERAPVLTLRCAFAVETTLYAAITPLLPYYADRFGLGKSGVSILSAVYPVGIVVGAIFGVPLAARIGIRMTAVSGLAALAVSTLVFAFASDLLVLDLGRLFQGMSAGWMWSGALAWLLIASGKRRGAAIGGMAAAAVMGMVAGPIIGSAATEFGPEWIYPIAVVAIIGLSLRLAGFSAPRSQAVEAPVGRALLRRDVVVGIWLVLFPGAAVGAVNALVPLRLAGQGASGLMIDATFFVAALVSAFVSPPMGRLTDRIGPAAPILRGLAIFSLCCLGIALADSTETLAVAVIALLGLALLAVWVPSMNLLSVRAEAAGAPAIICAAAINVSVSAGEAVGSPFGAYLATASGSDTSAFLLLAATATATIALLRVTSAVAQDDSRVR